MSQYINRRFVASDAGVHLVAEGKGTTLCGELVDSEAMIESKSRVVTCYDCAAIVRACRRAHIGPTDGA